MFVNMEMIPVVKDRIKEVEKKIKTLGGYL